MWRYYHLRGVLSSRNISLDCQEEDSYVLGEAKLGNAKVRRPMVTKKQSRRILVLYSF